MVPRILPSTAIPANGAFPATHARPKRKWISQLVMLESKLFHQLNGLGYTPYLCIYVSSHLLLFFLAR